jgi:putative copper resistance protein D
MTELLVITRAIHFGAALWLFGEFAFFVFVLRPALRSVAPDVTADLERGRRLIRVAAGCVAIAIVSSIAWLLLEAVHMSGTGLGAAFDRETLGAVVRETRFGNVWLVRLAISLLTGALLWWMARQRSRPLSGFASIAATLLAGAYAATLAAIGHAGADVGADRAIHLGCDGAHLLAAGAWVGALPGLVSLLDGASGRGRAGAFALAVAATRRFSALGMVSVSALVVSGFVNAFYLVGSLAALFGTDYGRLLVLKLLLFVVMVALAAVNRLRLAPRLAIPPSTMKGPPEGQALASLRRHALLEMAAGIAIVGIVAALGLTTPAVHMHEGSGTHPMHMEDHAH